MGDFIDTEIKGSRVRMLEMVNICSLRSKLSLDKFRRESLNSIFPIVDSGLNLRHIYCNFILSIRLPFIKFLQK